MPWLGDFIGALEGVGCLDDMRDELLRAFRRLGFERVAYHAQSLGPLIAHSMPIVHDSYPRAWVAHYLAREYHTIDPVVRQANREVLPFLWGSPDYQSVLDTRQRRLFAEAAVYGIRHGFTVPIHGPGDEKASLTILGDDSAYDEFETRIRAVQGQVVLAAKYYHERLKQLLTTSTPEIRLTSREIECLTWAAQGKTYEEIAGILGISKRTVVFHAQNAKQKLGVYAINHAISKALALGLIRP